MFDQSTQQVDQPALDNDSIEAHDDLWGYLDPLNKHMPRLEFYRTQQRYQIGRSDQPQFMNDYVLSDLRISE